MPLLLQAVSALGEPACAGSVQSCTLSIPGHGPWHGSLLCLGTVTRDTPTLKGRPPCTADELLTCITPRPDQTVPTTTSATGTE